MPRPDRRARRTACFRPNGIVEALEIRQVPAVIAHLSPTILEFDRPEYVVGQSQDQALIVLRRNSAIGTLDVHVRTIDGPAAGVNYRPVDSTVTFADGSHQATFTIPIIPGAPNSGQVRVGLEASSDRPGVVISGLNPRPGPRREAGPPATLLIVNRADVAPPSIVSTQATRDGIVLTFSEPMDPRTVANKRNYIVVGGPKETTFSKAVRLIQWGRAAPPPPLVPIRTANYDSATKTVTLVPRQPLSADGQYEVSSPNFQKITRIHARGGHDPRKPLTDLAGNVLEMQVWHDGTFMKLPVGPQLTELPPPRGLSS